MTDPELRRSAWWRRLPLVLLPLVLLAFVAAGLLCERGDPALRPDPAPAEEARGRPTEPTRSSAPEARHGPLSPAIDPDAVCALPWVARPAYLVPFTDPTFGTTLTRIADDPGSRLVAADGSPGVWSRDARHNYHSNQPWNADGTLLYLENKAAGGGSPGQLYLDGATYAVRFVTPPHLPGRGSADQRWHPSRDHAREVIVAERGGTTLYWFDVARDAVTRAWALPLPVTYLGNTKGNPSQDGRLLAIGDATHVFLVDMDPRPPHASYPAARLGPVYDLGAEGLPGAVSWYSVSPSGRYVVVHYQGDALRVLDVDPATLALTPRPMPCSYPGMTGDPARGFIYSLGHADMTLDPSADNDDVIVGQEHAGNVGREVPGVHTVRGHGVGHVVLVRLRDGTPVSLTDPGDGTAVAGEAYAAHISCRNVGRPGWCYVSYYPGAGRRFGGEIVAVGLDGSGAVERLAAHHSAFGTSGRSGAPDPDFDYRSEPHAVPSPDGRRVLFASNWMDQGNGEHAIQAYVLDTGR
jgi:hypothetical protein